MSDILKEQKKLEALVEKSKVAKEFLEAKEGEQHLFSQEWVLENILGIKNNNNGRR